MKNWGTDVEFGVRPPNSMGDVDVCPRILCSSARPVVLFNRVRAGMFDALFQHKVFTAAATQRELSMARRFCRTQHFYLRLAAWFRANPNLTFFYVHVCPPLRLGHVRCHCSEAIVYPP